MLLPPATFTSASSILGIFFATALIVSTVTVVASPQSSHGIFPLQPAPTAFPRRPWSHAAASLASSLASSVLASESGLALTTLALTDPDLDALFRTLRQLYIKAVAGPAMMFNVSEASNAVVSSSLASAPPSSNPSSDSNRLMFSLSRDIFATNRVPWISHENKLQQPLNATLIADLVRHINRAQVNRQPFVTPSPDSNAPGAWIVSPTEVRRLHSVGVTMPELDEIAKANYVAYTQMTPICIARYAVPKANTTSTTGNNTALSDQEHPDEALFLRVTAKEWKMVRADVATLVQRKLSALLMDPNATLSSNSTNATSLNANSAAEASSLPPGITPSTTSIDIFDPEHFRPFIFLGVTHESGLGFEEFDLGYADDMCWANVRIVDPTQLLPKNATNATANSNVTVPFAAASNTTAVEAGAEPLDVQVSGSRTPVHTGE